MFRFIASMNVLQRPNQPSPPPIAPFSLPPRPYTPSLLSRRTVLLGLAGLGGVGVFGYGLTRFFRAVSPPSLSPRPGVIVGRLVDSHGHPLEGSVTVDGVSTGGQHLTYPLTQAGPDGTYSVQVADGAYIVLGFANPTYQGVRWNLPMHPDGNMQVGLPSAPGIVKNFTWELTGLEPPPADGSPLDPANPYQHYGAVISLTLHGTPPVGSQFQFTLTPQGPLVDGSTGETLVFKRTVQTSVVGDFTFAEGQYPVNPRGPTDNFLSDIPLGVYSLSVTATDPNGTALSLQFNYGGSGTSVQWQPDIIGYTLGNLTVTVGS